MKKITILLTILLVLCSLCAFAACDPSTVFLEPTDLTDIVSVELIRYDNPRQKQFISWVPDHTSDLKAFDERKLFVLERLDGDKIPEFIDTLCECPILDRYYAFDSPNGICLKLTYINGEYLIVNCKEGAFVGYIGKFGFDGEVIQFIGCFVSVTSFETLVNDYFQMKI
ncbi:MAG: hypothetical protein J1F68_00035 [Clostridiales bacterium]|nr:hypothetical protein [Clostridiales bacterium]